MSLALSQHHMPCVKLQSASPTCTRSTCTMSVNPARHRCTPRVLFPQPGSRMRGVGHLSAGQCFCRAVRNSAAPPQYLNAGKWDRVSVCVQLPSADQAAPCTLFFHLHAQLSYQSSPFLCFSLTPADHTKHSIHEFWLVFGALTRLLPRENTAQASHNAHLYASFQNSGLL